MPGRSCSRPGVFYACKKGESIRPAQKKFIMFTYFTLISRQKFVIIYSYIFKMRKFAQKAKSIFCPSAADGSLSSVAVRDEDAFEIYYKPAHSGGMELEMSGRMLQSLILQMKEATDRVIGVVDTSGLIVACSDLTRIGEIREDAVSALYDSGEAYATSQGYTYKPLSNWSVRFDYAVFIQGEDEYAKSLCMMASVALNNAKSFYDEKHDKATFVKNIILDNILPGDIYVRSNELHFPVDTPYIVFLIRQIEKTDVGAVDVLQNLFPDKQRDFVLSISEQDLVLIKEVRMNVETKEFIKLAQEIEETLNSELYIKTVIGIGTVAPNLKDLAVSYKEAQAAIDVGKVFDTEKNIISYENLGIGRLIYQLPTTMCEMFLSEVFKKNSIDALDQETLFTIQKFFENNLNVSETSRKLFVHRNTLVYRLEKIKKITGLDLREFDHAIIFKVALMVKRYLSSRDCAY